MRYVMVRAQSQEQEDFDTFFNNSVIAVGWSDIDFSEFSDAEALVESVRSVYYSDAAIAPTTVGKRLSQIRRFFELEQDDIVIVPHWSSIVLARVTSSVVEHLSSGLAWERDLANQKHVEYIRGEDGEIRDIPRKQLTEGLSRRLRVMGSAVSDLSAFAAEIDDLLANRTWDSKFGDRVDKERLKQVRKLRERLGFLGMTNLEAGGAGLEQLVKEILEESRYQVEKPATNSLPVGADVDLEATWTDELGLAQATLLIQVKHHFGEADDYGGRQLVAALDYRDRAREVTQLALVTTAMPSKEAEDYCAANDISILDGDWLCEWLIDNGHRLTEEKRVQLGLAPMNMVMDV